MELNKEYKIEKKLIRSILIDSFFRGFILILCLLLMIYLTILYDARFFIFIFIVFIFLTIQFYFFFRFKTRLDEFRYRINSSFIEVYFINDKTKAKKDSTTIMFKDVNYYNVFYEKYYGKYYYNISIANEFNFPRRYTFSPPVFSSTPNIILEKSTEFGNISPSFGFYGKNACIPFLNKEENDFIKNLVLSFNPKVEISEFP